MSRSIRTPRYPPDMSDAECAVTERTLAWVTRCRRTIRDYERLAAHHEPMLHWAVIIVMTRHLARQPGQAPH